MNPLEYINANHNKFYQIARNISKSPLYKDLWHEVYLQLVDKDLSKFEDESQNLDGFIVRCIWFNWKDGYFKRKYQDPQKSSDDIEITEVNDIERWMVIEQVDLVLKRCDEFDWMVWEMARDGWKLRDIAKASDIPERTIYNSYKNIKDAIKNSVK